MRDKQEQIKACDQGGKTIINKTSSISDFLKWRSESDKGNSSSDECFVMKIKFNWLTLLVIKVTKMVYFFCYHLIPIIPYL